MDTQEQIIKLLKKYTNHNTIKLTNSGNLAILAAFIAVKLKGITEILIPDQGGWLTYQTYPKFLDLKIVELKTDYGILNLD